MEGGRMTPQPKLLPFELAKALAGERVVTRDGREVTGITLDDEFVSGLLDGLECAWWANGCRFQSGEENHCDLFLLAAQEAGVDLLTEFRKDNGLEVPKCTNHYSDGTKIFPHRECCTPATSTDSMDVHYKQLADEMKAAREEIRILRGLLDQARVEITTAEQKRDAFSRDAQLFMDQRDKLQAQLTTAELEGRVNEALKIGWRSGVTVSHNAVVAISDQHRDNDDADGSSQTAHECAKRIKQFLEPDFAYMEEMQAILTATPSAGPEVP
jgi:hypothetical protein